MSNVNVRKLKRNRKKIRHITKAEAENDQWHWEDGTPVDSEEMILSLLLPATVKEFYRRMEAEVATLCGDKGKHTEHPNSRWSPKKGSAWLGGQKCGVVAQRMRNTETNEEVPLPIYERHQNSDIFDRHAFREGIRRVSQRDYAKGVPGIAGAFGFSKGNVSRAWVRATKKKFEDLMHRDLAPLGVVAIFIDGKRFRTYGVIVALGVTEEGKKYVLGIYQADTENETACLGLLNDLQKRGCPGRGILYCVDGGSGLNLALESKFRVDDPEKREAIRLRCHNHKWDNLEKHLKKADKSTAEASSLFTAMRTADSLSTAMAHADALTAHLKRLNLSAMKSFLEAKDDLLMLHRLELGDNLKRFFATTNAIENLNSITEEDMRRVKRWKDSEHFQRWCATMSLNAEKRMKRVKGYRDLPKLRQRLLSLCATKPVDSKVVAA